MRKKRFNRAGGRSILPENSCLATDFRSVVSCSEVGKKPCFGAANRLDSFRLSSIWKSYRDYFVNALPEDVAGELRDLGGKMRSGDLRG